MVFELRKFHVSLKYEIDVEIEKYQLDDFEKFVVNLFDSAPMLFMTDFTTLFQNKLIHFDRVSFGTTLFTVEV